MVRKIKVIDIVLIFLVVILLIFSGPFLWHTFERYLVGFHHRAVMGDLVAWQEDYRVIHNDKEAFRAAGMVQYVQSYYVPGPGYESDPVTEKALEDQRKRLLTIIVNALQEYTGKDYGIDGEKWVKWRDHQKEIISAMEIYDDCKKTYSPNESLSLKELKIYYARTAIRSTFLFYMNDRWKIHSVVCLDEKNEIHYRPFILEGWIDVKGTLEGRVDVKGILEGWVDLEAIRSLEKKIQEDRTHVERQLIVVLVLDPKSSPEAAGKIIQALLKNPDVKLTLMFGRRTGEEPEITKKPAHAEAQPSTRAHPANSP